MSNAQLFEHNGYVHLKGFLDELNCQELTTELKRLVAEKKTVKDEQCPLSEAIHGTVTFDKLLEIYCHTLKNIVVRSYILLTVMLGFISQVKNLKYIVIDLLVK
jgi:hypothetical protein